MKVEAEQEKENLEYSLRDIYGRDISFRRDGRRRDMRVVISRTEAARRLNTTTQALKVVFDIGDGPDCHLYCKDSSGRVFYYFEKDMDAFAKAMERDGAALPMGIGDVARLLGISVYMVKALAGRGELGGFMLDGLWHFRPEDVKGYMDRQKRAARIMEGKDPEPEEEDVKPGSLEMGGVSKDVDDLCAALGEKGIGTFIVRTDGGRSIPVCLAKDVFKAVSKPCQCRQGKLTE